MDAENGILRKFGKFELDTKRKVLWHDGETVPMALKELELLCLLVENHGQLMTKNELMDKVWANSFVGENNLSRHIYLLRKTLKNLGGGEDLIENVARRGYRFTGEIGENDNHELIVEKHTLTQTLIEEIEDEKTISDIPLSNAFRFLRIIAGVGFAVILTISAIWFYRANNLTVAAKSPRTLAILPLQSLNKAEDENAFGAGITESLITRLGTLRSIVVRQTHFGKQVSELPENPIEIGRKLNADAVLTGTFQRANGRIRISVRLLNVADGSQIWAQNFDETETDIFKLQDSLSRQVAQSLTDKLSPQENQMLVKRYTENREAFESYLRGRYFFNKRDKESYQKAILEFERAVKSDPNYALAFTGLADVYALQASNSITIEERHRLYEKSKLTALKALEIDENLAEAHTTLGWIARTHEWNWEQSEKHFKRAIELNPNYTNARQWYAYLLANLGRLDESLIEINKARDLEPLTKVVLMNYQGVLIFRKEYEQLLELTEQIVKMDDDKSTNIRLLTIAHLHLGNDDKIIEIVEKYRTELNGQPVGSYILSNLAVAYYRTGNTAKANKLFESLEQTAKTDTSVAFRLALAYGTLGRKDEAILHLQKLYEVRDERMVWMKVEPRFDNLRDDKRFQEILRKMNLL